MGLSPGPALPYDGGHVFWSAAATSGSTTAIISTGARRKAAKRDSGQSQGPGTVSASTIGSPVPVHVGSVSPVSVMSPSRSASRPFYGRSCPVGSRRGLVRRGLPRTPIPTATTAICRSCRTAAAKGRQGGLLAATSHACITTLSTIARRCLTGRLTTGRMGNGPVSTVHQGW